MSKDTIARINKALAEGRQVYNTGRTFGKSKYPVYESLNPETRKLMGLKPLYFVKKKS